MLCKTATNTSNTIRTQTDRQDSFVCVVSGVAVWISFNEHQVARRTWKGAGVDWKQAEFDNDGNIVSLPKICPALLPANS